MTLLAEETNGIERQLVRQAMVRGESAEFVYTAFRNGGNIDDLSDRIDLSTASAFWRMKLNANDTAIEVAKSSATAAEILINPSQGPADKTRGQYSVFLIPFDTVGPPLLPVGNHVFDTWIVHPTLGSHAVVQLGSMQLVREITELTVTPGPPVTGTAAPQSTQEQSFSHTWSTTGLTDTVTIPFPMFNPAYSVAASLEDSAVFALFKFPSASKTATTFLAVASGSIPAGDTIDFIVRDR